MKTLLLLFLSATAFAEPQFHLKSGDLNLVDYLESASDQLGIALDLSTLGNLFKVNVPPRGPMSREAAMAQVLSILSLQGMTLVHDSTTDLYSALRIRDARDAALPVIKDPKDLPDNDLLVTFVFSLKHANPEEVSRLLRSFAPTHSRILPAPGLKAVLVTDSARSIKKYIEMSKSFDQPQFAKELEELRKERRADPDCEVEPVAASQTLFTVLFALIALIVGFLIRGYVIRRIEGGL